MAAKNKKSLGTGLDVLFRDAFETEESEKPLYVALSHIEPKENQPREYFNEDALQTLADSISRYGIIQPITVRSAGDGYYQIIAGERRWRAAKLAGLTEVPVNIIDADEQKAAELALVENLQREDLSPIEEAKGYQSLIQDFSLTQEQVSQRVGKSRSAVTNALRLLTLCPAVLHYIEEGKISAGHARALCSLSEENQMIIAEEIIKKSLSVRKTELLAASIQKATPNNVVVSNEVDYCSDVSSILTKHLGRKVTLKDGKKTGRIVIEYYGSDDREKLIEILKNL